MDYLDPAKQARHQIILFVGYILISVAIVIGAIILVNQAYGYGVGKNGVVFQNGLAYFSSQPNPANITINGTLNSATTNTRLYLPAGIYKIDLSRSGYYDWQRTIELQGGSVEHFDYPFLFPTKLVTSKISSNIDVGPSIFTQSPDRRWVVIGKSSDQNKFDVYDLNSPTKAPLSISLPNTLLSKATHSQSLQLVEWADDNQHILLEHDFDGKSEFVLVDRASPDQSTNLSTTLGLTTQGLKLANKKFDQYELFNATTQTLQLASLSSTTKTNVLSHVLAYKSYGNNIFLYVTSDGAPAGKVSLKMLSNNQTYLLHSLPESPAYVLDLTQYSGTLYVAAGASNSSKVYVYKDPLGQLAQSPNQAVAPVQVLRVDHPNYLSFSDNAQFIVAENGAHFGVYDIENQQGFNYTSVTAPDAPMIHAQWMDGNRLYYVSGGKLLVFDYDNTNQHTMEATSSNYLVAFAPNYKFVYSLATNPAGQYDLEQTRLLSPNDH